jgi:uncharacterized membrane protein YhaH (DUF805 family)
MQYLSRLLFGFDGRISRSDYWVAFVILQGISLAGICAIEPNYFGGDATHPVALAVLALALAIPEVAVCVKRFKDLEWPTWIACALVGAGTAASIAFDFTVDGSAANTALAFAVIALLLAEVIPCGFFKGVSPSGDAAFAS